MPDSDLPFPPPGSEQSLEATKDFTMLYGMALAAWAYLEEVLGLNFQRLTNLQSDMARLLFFSGRSFSTRADLYAAAISGAKGLSKKRLEAHKLLLKRARQFGSARNTIAHGMHVNLIGVPYEGIRIKQGHKVWEPGGVGRDELIAATENFQALSLAARKFLYSPDGDDEGAERCLEQVRALPTQAFPHAANHSPEAGE